MNLPEKVELRKTQTDRGTAGGSRSSFPLTIDSTTVASSLLRLQCVVISTGRRHRKCRTTICRLLYCRTLRRFWQRGRLHLFISLLTDFDTGLSHGPNYWRRLMLRPARSLGWAQVFDMSCCWRTRYHTPRKVTSSGFEVLDDNLVKSRYMYIYIYIYIFPVCPKKYVSVVGF